MYGCRVKRGRGRCDEGNNERDGRLIWASYEDGLDRETQDGGTISVIFGRVIQTRRKEKDISIVIAYSSSLIDE